jgi:hypothetical protein
MNDFSQLLTAPLSAAEGGGNTRDTKRRKTAAKQDVKKAPEDKDAPAGSAAPNPKVVLSYPNRLLLVIQHAFGAGSGAGSAAAAEPAANTLKRKHSSSNGESGAGAAATAAAASGGSAALPAVSALTARPVRLSLPQLFSLFLSSFRAFTIARERELRERELAEDSTSSSAASSAASSSHLFRAAQHKLWSSASEVEWGLWSRLMSWNVNATASSVTGSEAERIGLELQVSAQLLERLHRLQVYRINQPK